MYNSNTNIQNKEIKYKLWKPLVKKNIIYLCKYRNCVVLWLYIKFFQNNLFT